MEALKPLVWLAILGGMGYGAFTVLNRPSFNNQSLDLAPTWTAPTVSLGQPAGTSADGWGAPAGSAAPKFVSPSSPSSAGSSPFSSPSATTGSMAPIGSQPFASPAAPAFDSSGNAVISPAVAAPSGSLAPSAASLSAPLSAASPPPAPVATIPVVMTGAPSSEAAPPGRFADSWAAAQAALGQQRLAEALKQLTPWRHDTSLSPTEDAELTELLDQLAGTVIYSREHHLAPAYRVQVGEQLATIAKGYNIPWQLLANINGIKDPTQLTPGSELKVLTGPFEATANLRRHELTLTVQGMYAGTFLLGVGAQMTSLTEDMAFQVHEKNPEPKFEGPDRRVLQAGEPGNPWGSRWLSLSSAGHSAAGVSLMAIHGSAEADRPNPDGAPGYLSLSPRDAADVYNILAEGSLVSIRR